MSLPNSDFKKIFFDIIKLREEINNYSNEHKQKLKDQIDNIFDFLEDGKKEILNSIIQRLMNRNMLNSHNNSGLLSTNQQTNIPKLPETNGVVSNNGLKKFVDEHLPPTPPTTLPTTPPPVPPNSGLNKQKEYIIINNIENWPSFTKQQKQEFISAIKQKKGPPGTNDMEKSLDELNKLWYNYLMEINKRKRGLHFGGHKKTLKRYKKHRTRKNRNQKYRKSKKR